MAIIIAVLLFLGIAVSIIWYGHRTFARPAQVLENLASSVPGVTAGVENLHAPASPYQISRFLLWVGEKLPADPASKGITRRQLMAAGFRSEAALPIFFAIRAIVITAFVMGAMGMSMFVGLPPIVEYSGWIAAAVLGFLLSGVGLDLLVTRYQESLRFALPDMLDLLIVCVEAGLGLDQAIRKVCDELALTHPNLCSELHLVSLEMRTGLKRADAMRNLADRTMEPELRKFVAVLVQTDRFGTSMAESLRAHADFMRIRRRQDAEERISKLGVKLIIPVFFLILPAIMIVTGGPSFLRIAKELMPALQNVTGR